MRWKQFFTRVNSLDAPEAKKFMNKLAGDQFNLLDVRQPAEYESGHVPGSKRIKIDYILQAFKRHSLQAFQLR